MRRTTKRKEQSGSPTKDTNDPSKRMRQTNSPVSFDFSETQSVADFGKAALKVVREATESRRRGILIASNFETLPSKADLPEYYTIITNPIALDTIESKLDLDSYQSVQEILEDFKLMETNANTFNKTNSLIAQFSTKIRVIVEELVGAFNAAPSKTADGATPEVNGPPYKEIQDELLGVIYSILNEVRDSSGQSFVGDFFRSLVPKKEYPNYYQIIKNPISLREIERKLKNKNYPPDAIVSCFENDIFLMLSNCALFNEPTSEVMADARILEAWFINTMASKRKDLNQPPRTLPPEGGQEQSQMKPEDAESKPPRITLKMNGPKKAGSPSSISATNSLQTTAASTPTAFSTAQSPPPGPESLGRNPFQTSRSPHPAAASPAKIVSEKSLSPAIVTPQSQPSAPQIPIVKPDQKLPQYADFRLNSHSIKNGLILQPAEATNHSILRRPGTTKQDSPIRAIEVSIQPGEYNESRTITIRPELDRWRCGSIIPLNPGQTNIRFEIIPHQNLLLSPHGLWVQHPGHHPTSLSIPPPESKRRCIYEFRATPGKDNYLDFISDMVVTNGQNKEYIEKALFWFNFVIGPPN
ncbi:hypothetical protein TWF225_006040 [Orbilia oligospora]|nr:hypothetical protein TWF225_006040 [Orbilia oligospora]KAF3242950.1 hypothetical protein TWF128_010401 [Orbilia oligospora]KAF3257792.1 hypothetical protein TWF217_005900 [Orbilia oligospora]